MILWSDQSDFRVYLKLKDATSFGPSTRETAIQKAKNSVNAISPVCISVNVMYKIYTHGKSTDLRAIYLEAVIASFP